MLLLTNIYDFIMQHFLCSCAHFHSQYTVSSHCIHRNIIMLDKLQKMCNTAICGFLAVLHISILNRGEY